MAKRRYNIIVMCNGVSKGFLKSVSYSSGKFTLTPEKMNAKGYTSEDTIQRDIDFLTSVNYENEYVFIYK